MPFDLIDTGGRMSGHGLRAVSLIGGVVFIVGAALLALALPIYASSGDSTVGCGTLVFRHRFPLREEFCVEEGSYQTRRQLVFGMAGLGIAGVLVGAWRTGHRLVEAPRAIRATVGLLVATSLAVVILSARPDRTVQPQPPPPPPASAPAG